MKHFLSLSIAASLLCAAETASAQNAQCEYPEVLLLLDRSNSMLSKINNTSKWNIAKNALTGLVNQYTESTKFGLMLYPGPSGEGSKVSGARTSSGTAINDQYACISYGAASTPSATCNADNGCTNICAPTGPRCTTGEVAVDIGLNTASAVLSNIDTNSPVSNSYTPTWQSLWAANDYYTDRGLTSSSSKRYVILITDGWQCCGIYNDGGKCADSTTTYMDQQITEVQNLKDSGISTFVIGFSATTGGVDAVRLNKMAIAGGTAREGCNTTATSTTAVDANPCYYYASNSNDLNNMLSSIARLISDERCDGLDNDCNGLVDDGLESTETCSTACGTGYKTCLNGQWIGCSARTPTTEIPSNGIDDDCDGLTDEDCDPGEQRICNALCGTATGHETCTSRGTWGPCDAPESTVEICGNNIDDNCNGETDECCVEYCFDGIDNDCDGQTDENCEEICGDNIDNNGNGFTDENCDEICFDNIDNDGDGLTDEDCGPCMPGEVEACGSSEGACQAGTRTCGTNHQWQNCVGMITPTAEICNNIDDDCDGQTDEDLVQTCNTGCGVGTTHCMNGTWTECDGDPISGEICDGIDNDCDGLIDENLTQTCQTACGTGSQKCVAGVWSECDAPLPQSREICGNGIDDDCNGLIDDGCACADGDTQPCGSNVGECKEGVQKCTNGAWGSCIGEVKPSVEICDGLDNDCDGVADEDGDLCGEGLFCSCGGCNSPCQFGECPQGECQGGYCIEDHCPTGYVCQSGTCVQGERNQTADGGTYHPTLEDQDAGLDEGGSSEGSCSAVPGQAQGPAGAALVLLALAGLSRRRRD